MTRATRQRSEIHVWRRVGAAALVLGGILILTSALFPVPDDPADLAGFLSLLTENAGRTQLVLATVPVGIWLFAAGVAAIRRALGERSAWYRLGFYAVLVGSSVVTVQFALGTAALAEATHDRFDAGLVLWVAGTYMRAFAMLILWGGVAVVGFGMLADAVAPWWARWAPTLLGTAMVVVSGANIVGGLTSVTARAYSALAALTAIWSIVLGIWFVRSRTAAMALPSDG